MAVSKLLRGLKNINFAAYENGTFKTPVPITFAKACENKLNYESEGEWADDRIVSQENMFSGGEGKISVLGLTKEEQAALFGNQVVKGGVVVKSTDVAPTGAFLFQRGKKNSSHSRYYVVYACTCSPSGFSGETVEDGKASAGVEEINYAIGETVDGLIYHYVDTDDSTVDQATITKWFTEVQFPKDLAPAAEVKLEK